jgi:hypothetical protein
MTAFPRWHYLLLAGGLAAVAGWLALHAAQPPTAAPPPAAGAAPTTPLSTGKAQARHPVEIHHPSGPPRIATGKVDALGREITLSCGSCHANRSSNPDTARGEQLKEFHQGLNFQHGALKCVSCHHPVDYNSLRLAEGRSLAYTHVQTLCSQCHAPQAADYEHGAHGGMNGYWDLTRGPRQRKGCIDCHDPHAPAFPSMAPTFKSRDRFLSPRQPGASHE